MLIRLKTNDEIGKFAKVGDWTARIMAELVKFAEPGRTTSEINDAAIGLCSGFQVRPIFLGYKGFPAAVCVSVNDELVHGIPGNRRLVAGDLVKIDLGIECDGFIGDMAKTIRVGGARGDRLDAMVLDCQTALMRGIAAARPGCDLGDIGAEIHDTARMGGWKAIVAYGGHGIDRGVLHADPFVDNIRTRRLRLRPGMVLAIEPMFVAGPDDTTRVADDKWTVLANGPTAHFEHTIVVAELGEPRVLTKREEE